MIVNLVAENLKNWEQYMSDLAGKWLRGFICALAYCGYKSTQKRVQRFHFLSK